MADEKTDPAFEVIYETYAKNQEKGLLTLAYSRWDDNSASFFKWNGEYDNDEDLRLLYTYLERLGYLMSDEEKALRDGTHELFVRPELEESS